MLKLLQDKEYWNSTWNEYFTHYQQDLRHSYYINAFLKSNEKKILEIGAGSFRDFANLNNMNVDCFAFDYCDTSVNRARQFFPDLSHKIFQENAFETSFKDKEFDFTFHNGFWGCFDDAQILLLAKEQIRITSKRFSFTLHNGHNENFIDYFKRLSLKDSMYTVRFFTYEHVYHLLATLNITPEQVTIYPVGKGKKSHEDLLIAQNIPDIKKIHKIITDSKNKYLTSSERLLCIVNMSE